MPCFTSIMAGTWILSSGTTVAMENHFGSSNSMPWLSASPLSALGSLESMSDGMFVLPVSRAKPAPSHTQANARISPAAPALKPSYSQVTRLGIRACDPGKTHVTETRDQPRDLQVLWGSRDPRTRDPGKM